MGSKEFINTNIGEIKMGGHGLWEVEKINGNAFNVDNNKELAVMKTVMKKSIFIK